MNSDLSHFLNAEKLASLFDSLPLGVVVHGPDGRVISANGSALEILGLSLAEITGKTSMDPDWQAIREDGSPYPGQDHPAMICLARHHSVKGTIMGVKSQADGTLRWLHVHANPLWVDGVLAGAYACFEDITQRRQLEKRLDDVREKLELALLGADLGTYDADLPSGTVDVNERYLALLGYTPGELQMSVAEWMNRIHPDDLPRIQAHYDHIVTTSAKYVDVEYRLRHRDAHWVWLHDRGRVFETDAAGQPVHVAGTQMDISARKQVELALHESETRYRTVVESAPVAIMIYIENRVAMANPACVTLFRAKSEAELIGRDGWSLTSPKFHPLVSERIQRAMQTGGVNPIAEIEIVRLDGTPLPIDGVSAGIEYQGHRAIHVMMYDATPRKMAETLLRQHREEMEQTLAFEVAHQTVASIAHELNQPLNAVTTLAEAAQQLTKGLNPLPSHLAETLEGIAHGAQRAGRVLHELLGFMNKPDIVHGAVDLGMLVHEAVAQCKAGLPFAGEIQIRFPVALCKVTGNVLQIEKIVQNLLSNAIEACQAGRTTDGRAEIVIEGFDEGANIRLQVSDNGPGVPVELIPRLFQPFVSSKRGGIGMGLAISHALARSLGGTLSHQPVPGGGACFCLKLPVANDIPGVTST